MLEQDLRPKPTHNSFIQWVFFGDHKSEVFSSGINKLDILYDKVLRFFCLKLKILKNHNPNWLYLSGKLLKVVLGNFPDRSQPPLEARGGAYSKYL